MADRPGDSFADFNLPSRAARGSRRPDVSQLFEALERKGPEQAKLLTNSLGMKFVLVPAGDFWMGSKPGDPLAKPCELPQHVITLSQPFYLGVTPVTQEQYQRVMGKNPSRFNADGGGGPDHPVETVTWDDALAFCRKLAQRPDEQQGLRSYRLPTEAEWEYACRAGSDTIYHTGAGLSPEQANFDTQHPSPGMEPGRPRGGTSPSGTYLANNFGLSDMHGNVWEWCADWFSDSYYRKSSERDPQGPTAGRFRVLRGGSWNSHAATCRAAYRNALAPHHADAFTGFRIVAVTA